MLQSTYAILKAAQIFLMHFLGLRKLVEYILHCFISNQGKELVQ